MCPDAPCVRDALIFSPDPSKTIRIATAELLRQNAPRSYSSRRFPQKQTSDAALLR